MSTDLGKIIGWAAIVISIIGVFVWSIPLGSAAMILSLLGLVVTEEKGLNWTALALGAVTVIIGIL